MRSSSRKNVSRISPKYTQQEPARRIEGEWKQRTEATRLLGHGHGAPGSGRGRGGHCDGWWSERGFRMPACGRISAVCPPAPRSRSPVRMCALAAAGAACSRHCSCHQGNAALAVRALSKPVTAAGVGADSTRCMAIVQFAAVLRDRNSLGQVHCSEMYTLCRHVAKHKQPDRTVGTCSEQPFSSYSQCCYSRLLRLKDAEARASATVPQPDSAVCRATQDAHLQEDANTIKGWEIITYKPSS